MPGVWMNTWSNVWSNAWPGMGAQVQGCSSRADQPGCR
nr:MAG TPA: hypothetical protein [Caudoviricetes sp.]